MGMIDYLKGLKNGSWPLGAVVTNFVWYTLDPWKKIFADAKAAAANHPTWTPGEDDTIEMPAGTDNNRNHLIQTLPHYQIIIYYYQD